MKSKRLKLWSTLSAAAFMTACGEASEEPPADDEARSPYTADDIEISDVRADPPQAAAPGEGGEGGAAAQADIEGDDIAYLTQLGLMRGHLFVGLALYREGAIDHARMHMKHPSDELYAGVVAGFAPRGADGFAGELETLAAAVEGDASADDVERAYADVLNAIGQAEAAAPLFSDPASRLRVATELVRIAGEEYAIGVIDGRLVNGHEYQDAYGFTQIAKRILQDTAFDDAAQEEAFAAARARLDTLDDLWPSLVPPETVQGDAARLFGAAARLDIIAFNLEETDD